MGHEHDGKKRSDIITFHEQDMQYVLCMVLALMILGCEGCTMNKVGRRSDIITSHEQDGKHVLCTVLALMFLSWSFGLTDRRVRLAYNIKRNMIVFARLLLRWSSEFAKTSRLDSSDMSTE